VHLLYALASYLLFVALLPVLLWHPKLRHGIPFRLGFYRRSFDLGRGSPRIWLHGASAGDLLSLHPMMKELKARLPGCCIIVTTITNSGLAMARQKLSEADVICHAPYDLFGATRRAVAALRPDLLVLEYTEIWPNLIRAARKANVRIALTNGRFNPAKMARYRLFFRAISNPLRRIDCFLMRSDEEAERVLALGAAPDRVWVTGNTKFDALVLDEAAGREAALRAEMARKKRR
jgi:3-deoxy-D-manno-octulosonic-acid transferase